jgi:hypothetical protein
MRKLLMVIVLMMISPICFGFEFEFDLDGHLPKTTTCTYDARLDIETCTTW